MAKPQYPSEKLDQYMLRFPDGMREQLKDIAASNGRSLNAEIIHRLQTTLDIDKLDEPPRGNVAAEIRDDALEAFAKLGRYLNNARTNLDRILGASDRTFEVMPVAPELPEHLRAQPVELSPDQLARLSEDIKSHIEAMLTEKFSLPSDQDPDQPTPSGGGGGNNWLPQGRFGPARKMHQRDK